MPWRRCVTTLEKLSPIASTTDECPARWSGHGNEITVCTVTHNTAIFRQRYFAHHHRRWQTMPHRAADLTGCLSCSCRRCRLVGRKEVPGAPIGTVCIRRQPTEQLIDQTGSDWKDGAGLYCRRAGDRCLGRRNFSWPIDGIYLDGPTAPNESSGSEDGMATVVRWRTQRMGTAWLWSVQRWKL